MDRITEYITAKALSTTCQRQYRRSLESLSNGHGLLDTTPEQALGWFASLRVGDTTRRPCAQVTRSSTVSGGWACPGAGTP
jgi:hypothetical protein